MSEEKESHWPALGEVVRNYEALLDEMPRSEMTKGSVGLDAFWGEVNESGISRRQRLTQLLSEATRLEVLQKVENNLLLKRYQSVYDRYLLRESDALEPCVYHVDLVTATNTSMRIAGAWLLCERSLPDDADELSNCGSVLLYLPAKGLKGYSNLAHALGALDQCLEQPFEREALLALLSTKPPAGADVIDTSRWSFVPVVGPLFEQCARARLQKMNLDVDVAANESELIEPALKLREGVEEAFALMRKQGLSSDLRAHREAIDDAKARRDLPLWFKQISAGQAAEYAEHMKTYDLARLNLQSTMERGWSPRQSARIFFRKEFDRRLNRNLDPDLLMVTTARKMLATGEIYTITSSLFELLWSGLHPGDEAANSEFARSSLYYRGELVTQDLIPGLTPALVAELIAPWQLRAQYPLQYEFSLGNDVRNKMAGVTDARLRLLSLSAGFQGHLSGSAQERIQGLRFTRASADDSGDHVHMVTLAGCRLADVLVFSLRQPDQQPDDFLLYAPQAPGKPDWQRFVNRQRLQQTLLSWGADPDLRRYLVERALSDERSTLERRLDEYAQKPQLLAGDLTLEAQANYAAAVQRLVDLRIELERAQQRVNSPKWYSDASPEDRRTLIAYEDQIQGMQSLYKSHSHTHIQPFEDYVRDQAKTRLNALLGLPVGTVDPDQVIITSPRETVSFTQLMRNGYDDSVSFSSETLATQATFAGPEGVDLRLLTSEKVAGAVRGKWLADQYCALIRERLLDATGQNYAYRRQVTLEITRLQMRYRALADRLKGDLSQQQWQWLNQSLDSLERTDAVSRDQYRVYQLALRKHSKKDEVDGLYLFFDPAHNADRQRALLFTPGAPDGKSWRIYGSFPDFLKVEGMADYVLQRFPATSGQAVTQRLQYLRGDEALDSNGSGRSLPLSDLNERFYDSRIEARLREVDDSTLSREEMVLRLVSISFELIATALTLPFPPASFAVGMALWAKDTAQSLQSLTRGDHEQAAGHTFAAVLNGLGAVGDATGGVKGLNWLGWLWRLALELFPAKVVEAVTDSVGKAVRSQRKVLELGLGPETALKRRPKGNLEYRPEGRYAGLYEGARDASGFRKKYFKDETGYWYRVSVDADGVVRLFTPNASGHGAPLQHLGNGTWEVWRSYGGLGGADAIDQLLEGLRGIGREEADELARQLGLVGGSRSGHFQQTFQTMTRRDVEWLLQEFEWSEGAEFEAIMIRHVAQNRRLPDWALQFRRGAVRDSAETMLARARLAYPHTAVDVRVQDFAFPAAQRERMTFELALHLEVHGRIPPGALDYRLPGTSDVARRLGAHLYNNFPPSARVGQALDPQGWQVWGVNIPDVVPPGVPREAVTIGDRIYSQLPDNRSASVNGAPAPSNYPGYRIIRSQGLNFPAYQQALLEPRNSSAVLRDVHLIESVSGEWVHFGPPFIDPPARIIGEVYPRLLPQSRIDLARWMLSAAEPGNSELTVTRLMRTFEALSAWRGRGGRILVPEFSDPLALLPQATPIRPGGRQYQLSNPGGGQPVLGFYPPGNDPLRSLAQMLQDSGYGLVYRGNETGFGLEHLLLTHPRSNNLYLIIRTSDASSVSRMSVPGVEHYRRGSIAAYYRSSMHGRVGVVSDALRSGREILVFGFGSRGNNYLLLRFRT